MNPEEFCFIEEAAKILGVNKNTLRGWDKRGIFVTYRHPINSYRMYKRTELEEFLKKLQESKKNVGTKL